MAQGWHLCWSPWGAVWQDGGSPMAQPPAPCSCSSGLSSPATFQGPHPPAGIMDPVLSPRPREYLQPPSAQLTASSPPGLLQGIPSLPKLHSLATGTRIQTVLLLWKRLHRPPGLDTGSASGRSCPRSRGGLALNTLHGILPVQLLSGPTEWWLVPWAYNMRMTTSTFYCTNRFYLDMATQQILTSDHHG